METLRNFNNSSTGTEAKTFSNAMSGKMLPQSWKPFQSEMDIVEYSNRVLET